MNEAVEYCKSIAEELQEAHSVAEFINERELCTEYILNSNKQLISCRIYVTLQGPTVWIDTEEGCVKYSHMNDKGFWGLPAGMSDKINDYIYWRDFA